MEGIERDVATEFSNRVIIVILNIPIGKVATYGQIAALAGKPHAARGVSWILHSSSASRQLPWHRVLGAKGRISFPKGSTHYVKQRRQLARENVRFKRDGDIDLAIYQWSKKAPRERRTMKRSMSDISRVKLKIMRSKK